MIRFSAFSQRLVRSVPYPVFFLGFFFLLAGFWNAFLNAVLSLFLAFLRD